MTISDARDDALFGLLDAYLDDELTATERSAVESLLERRSDARAELAAIDRVRSLVRGLPQVEPPFGFYERLVRSSRRAPGMVVATVGAVAAAIVLILAVTPVVDRVAPPVDDLAARHTMLAASTGEMPPGYEPMPMDESASTDMAAAPPTVGGFERMAAYEAPEGVHVVYALGAQRVSVFEQLGHVDWSELPDGGERMSVGEQEAWTMSVDSTRGRPLTADASSVTVLDRDGMVVTIVGDLAAPDARSLAEAMPMPAAPTVVERISDACAWVAEGFGFP